MIEYHIIVKEIAGGKTYVDMRSTVRDATGAESEIGARVGAALKLLGYAEAALLGSQVIEGSDEELDRIKRAIEPSGDSRN